MGDMSERVSGAELLRRRLVDLGWSQTELSRRIDASTGIVSRWLAGQRKPSLEMAFRIEVAAGLPAESWVDDPTPADESGEHSALPASDAGTGTEG